MLNYKTILVLIFASAMLYSCMPRSQSFCYSYTIKKDFFAEAMAANDMEGIDIDSIEVYRAHLVERLVERDAVPEYKLVNTYSNQPYAELADSKNYHYLYLFRLYPKGSDERVMVYMSTSFSANNTCTGLGPVYTGIMDISDKQAKIHFESILEIKKIKKKDDPGYKKMKITMERVKKQKMQNENQEQIEEAGQSTACRPGELKRKFTLKYVKDTHLIFLPGKTFTQTENKITLVRIEQIIRKEANKIGGEKPVIFTTNRVFGDEEALVFTYFETIK